MALRTPGNHHQCDQDHNKIERTWQDLHANVTRNHCCPDMASLMRELRAYLRQHNRDIRVPLQSTA